MLHEVPTYNDAGAFHVVVESPRGSGLKLKFDPRLRVMTLSRPLPIGLTYPFDWGFIPGTHAADGDPLDAFVLADIPGHAGIVVACRALGVVEVDQRRAGHPDERERNDRVIAVPAKFPRFDGLKTVFDCAERWREEVSQFFLNVTAFEGKDARILGWKGPDEASRLIAQTAASAERTHA
jgi:inorganic pyrophosphatase